MRNAASAPVYKGVSRKKERNGGGTETSKEERPSRTDRNYGPIREAEIRKRQEDGVGNDQAQVGGSLHSGRKKAVKYQKRKYARDMN